MSDRRKPKKGRNAKGRVPRKKGKMIDGFHVEVFPEREEYRVTNPATGKWRDYKFHGNADLRSRTAAYREAEHQIHDQDPEMYEQHLT